MNIYEKLNKINDTKSLSEKYNVKNAKELKSFQENFTDADKLLSQAIATITSLKSEIEQICQEYRASSDEEDFDPTLWGEPADEYSDDSDMLWEYQDKLKNLLLNRGVSPAVISAVVDYGSVFDDRYNFSYEQLYSDIESLSSFDVEEFLEESLKEDVQSSKIIQEAERICDDLRNKGYTNDDIRHIANIVYASAFNKSDSSISNLEKIKAAIPGLIDD